MNTNDNPGSSPSPPRERLRSPEQDQQDLPDAAPCAGDEAAVPADSAVHEEVQDYVRHFCGQDCHAEWLQRAREEIPAPAPDAGKEYPAIQHGGVPSGKDPDKAGQDHE